MKFGSTLLNDCSQNIGYSLTVTTPLRWRWLAITVPSILAERSTVLLQLR